MELGRFKKPLPAALGIITALAIIAFLYYYWKFLFTLIYGQFFNEQAIGALLPQVGIFLALIIGTEIFLVISRFAFSRYLTAHYGKKELRVLLNIYTYLAWGFVAIIIIAGIIKDVGALLTSLGLIGFGLTLALQKPILNFVGWLAIMFTDPFVVGERIEVSGVRGDVIAVSTMYTRIQGTRASSQQKSEQIITLPNDFILTNAVMNYSRMDERYTDDLTFNITYESNWKKAAEVLERIALEATMKYINKAPKTTEERLAWQQALRLLREAPKKLRKGLIRGNGNTVAAANSAEAVNLAEGENGAALPEIQKPNVLVILAESSINLNVTYQTGLRAIRATKNEITRGFAEEVEKSKDIEFAYPHVQVVSGDKTKGRKGASKSILAYSE